MHHKLPMLLLLVLRFSSSIITKYYDAIFGRFHISFEVKNNSPDQLSICYIGSRVNEIKISLWVSIKAVQLVWFPQLGRI